MFQFIGNPHKESRGPQSDRCVTRAKSKVQGEGRCATVTKTSMSKPANGAGQLAPLGNSCLSSRAKSDHGVHVAWNWVRSFFTMRAYCGPWMSPSAWHRRWYSLVLAGTYNALSNWCSCWLFSNLPHFADTFGFRFIELFSFVHCYVAYTIIIEFGTFHWIAKEVDCRLFLLFCCKITIVERKIDFRYKSKERTRLFLKQIFNLHIKYSYLQNCKYPEYASELCLGNKLV